MSNVQVHADGDQVRIEFDSRVRPERLALVIQPGEFRIVIGRAASEILEPFDAPIDKLPLFKTPSGVVFLEDRCDQLGLAPTATSRVRNQMRRSSLLGTDRGATADEHWSLAAQRVKKFSDLIFDDEARAREIEKVMRVARATRAATVMLQDTLALSSLYSGVDGGDWVALQIPYAPRLQDLLLVEMWRRAGSVNKLLAYCVTYDEDAFEDIAKRKEFALRDYIEISDIDRSLSVLTGATASELSKIYKIWCSVAETMWGEVPDKRELTVADAENYANTVAAYKRGQTEFEQIVEGIPEQVVAPVVFSGNGPQIDVVDTGRVLSSPSVSGGARALENILSDFRQNSVVDNVVPAVRRKSDRIQAILRMFQAGEVDDGYVVELGLEINSLGVLVEAHDPLLGQESIGVLAMFMEPAAAYLDQFPAWRTYDASLSASHSPEIGAGADVAKEVLQGFLHSEGLLTGRAKLRLDAYMAEVEPSQASASEREGVARTGENLTSAVTRKALEIAGNELEGAAEDAVHTSRVIVQNAVGEALKENVPNLAKLANARNLFWLGRLLGMISGE